RAVEALPRTGQVLWIAGDGQDARLLRAGLPPNVRWLGKVPDADVPELYRGARALVFPGEEDFGIAPLGALASRRPGSALARGGALETLTPETGLLFDTPEPEALVEALRQFESFERSFEPARARARAEIFSEERFRAAVQRKVEALVAGRPDLRDRLPWECRDRVQPAAAVLDIDQGRHRRGGAPARLRAGIRDPLRPARGLPAASAAGAPGPSPRGAGALPGGLPAVPPLRHQPGPDPPGG